MAYLRAGDLHVVDLATELDRTLVVDAAPPQQGQPSVVTVRWSPDGRWIAFGPGDVVGSEGGAICQPLGTPVVTWSWSPVTDELAGITDAGGLLIGGPGRPTRTLLPAGWGASAVFGPTFDPTGRSVAVGRIRQGSSGSPGRGSLWVVDVTTGHATELVRAHRALPIVAGWTADQRWIVWWEDEQFSSSIAADGLGLRATSLDGVSRSLVGPVLVHADFLTWCRENLVVAAGGGRDVLSGKRLFVFTHPPWSSWTSPNDEPPNWIWPACSPDGRWVAASAGAPPSSPYRYGHERREIWLVGSHGADRHELIRSAPSFADDLPRWSSDGRSILFVRRTLTEPSSAELFIVSVDPVTGTRLAEPRLVADLGSAKIWSDGYGYYAWSQGTDWFRSDGSTKRPSL